MVMLLYRHFIWLMEKTSNMRRKNGVMYDHTKSADTNTAQINPKGKRIIQAGNEAIAHFDFLLRVRTNSPTEEKLVCFCVIKDKILIPP